MKFLLLVIITTWSFGSAGFLPQKEIVGSPQQAAIIIYQNEQNKISVEPDQHRYELYEVDLDAKTIKAIQIPELQFVHPQPKAETGKE